MRESEAATEPPATEPPATEPTPATARDARSDFESWARPLLPDLVRFAVLVAGSQHAGEDAAQTALSQAWQRWDRIVALRDPETYLRRMIVNAHITAWRRVGRRESPVAVVRERADGPASTQASDDDRLWEACLRLPPRQRAAVVLRYYEGLDDEEIAQVLGCRRVTVRTNIHRGLAALRATASEER